MHTVGRQVQPNAGNGGSTVWEQFDQVAQQYGQQLACVLTGSSGDRGLSYEELRTASVRLAAGLTGLGLQRGEVLAAWLPNLPELLVLEVAAARLGLILIGMNIRFRAEELAHVLSTSGARALVFSPSFLGIDFLSILERTRSQVELPRLEHLIVVGEPRPATGLDQRRYAELLSSQPSRPSSGQPDDLLNLFTTSGTTGGPKLAAHTQASIVRHALNVARAYDVAADGAMLAALPLCGEFGFQSAMAGLLVGATVVLQPVFQAEEAVQAMAQHGVTVFHGIDSMLQAMVAAPGFGRQPLHRWRRGGFASFTAQLLPTIAAVEAQLDVRLMGVYGSSECHAMMATWLPDEPLERRGLDGGHLVDTAIQVRVVDPATGALVPIGTPGELQVRGYNVVASYVANAAATQRAFTPDGWYRTNDLGYLCDDGAMVYLARLGDSLRLGGFLVSPGEIEAYLGGHPVVRAAQVVGVTHAGHGDLAVAFVQPHPGEACDPATLLAYCREGMASYKVPAQLFVIDNFPTTPGPNGEKIQKGQLRELALERLQEHP